MKLPTAMFVRRLALLFCAGALAASCKTHEGLSEEQRAALQDVGFHKEDSNSWKLDFRGRLLFPSNDSELSGKSRETIARAAKVLTEIGILKVWVDGHADSTGNAALNEKLSLRRAEAVAQELENNGLPRSGITVRALGSENPVSNNATPEGRAQNRRVAIIIQVE